MKFKLAFWNLWAFVLLWNCGVYSFTGVTFPPEIKSVYIAPVENVAANTPSQVDFLLNDAIKDNFLKFSELNLSNSPSDLNIYARIVAYDISSVSPSQDQAYQTRITMQVSVRYVQKVPEEKEWSRSFSRFVDIPADKELAQVEQQVIDELVRQLSNDIFYGSGQDW